MSTRPTASAPVQIGTHAGPESFSVTVSLNGPYIVKGAPVLVQTMIETDAQGASIGFRQLKTFDSKDGMALCRCGHSKHAPFCDGSHLRAGVDMTERAPFEPLLAGAQEIDGPALALTDNEHYCAFGRFCDAGENIWAEVTLPGQAHQDMATRQAHHCPGGRLMIWDIATRQPIEPAEAPSISAIEDPAQGCSGPLMVRGGIRVISADGRGYEIRNRQALCRCGASNNKPFCDGSHASVKYQDGIA